MITLLQTLCDTAKNYAWWWKIASRCRKGFSGPVSESRHVALLAWSFPPDIDGGVHRPLSLARYGVDCGWAVTVFSGPVREGTTAAGLTLLDGLPGDVRVCRTSTENLPVPSYKLFPRINGGFVHGLNLVQTAMRALSQSPPSVIVATGPPFHSFMAAWYLSRYFGAKLVLDYRDEWTECPFTFVDRGNVDRWWERRCLEKADAVIFTTESQLKHNRTTFNAGDPNKFHVVPNGWEAADFEKAKTATARNVKDKELLFSFIGALGDHSLPGVFLRQVEQVLSRRNDLQQKLKFQFIGKRSRQAEEQLASFTFPESLRIYDHVSKIEANRLMAESTALLIFYSDNFKRYVPGKFYDYLAARRPLLVVGAKGEVPDILEKLQVGCLVPEGDDVELERALDLLCADNEIDMNSDAVDRWLADHTRERLAYLFFDTIEKII